MWWTKRKPPASLPSFWNEILRFVFTPRGDRIYASIVVPVVENLNPNGWANLEELEAYLPQAIEDLFGGWGRIVVYSHYHARSRTMFVYSRVKPIDWQDTPEGKAQLEAGYFQRMEGNFRVKHHHADES